mmetsp:Transcript_14865/g.25775  ORF Transcript_14865/g.25775 Transcript_14865/m.25775 type:complete len:175 (+) Transcript_14865:53-577(+)
MAAPRCLVSTICVAVLLMSMGFFRSAHAGNVDSSEANDSVKSPSLTDAKHGKAEQVVNLSSSFQDPSVSQVLHLDDKALKAFYECMNPEEFDRKYLVIPVSNVMSHFEHLYKGQESEERKKEESKFIASLFSIVDGIKVKAQNEAGDNLICMTKGGHSAWLLTMQHLFEGFEEL